MSPKGWFKTRIFTFGVAIRICVEGNLRHFKFGMWMEHSKSQYADDKPSLNWAWLRHVTHFKFLIPLRYLWNGLSKKNFKYGVHVDYDQSPSLRTTNCL